ncbi:MAG: ABC transporter [Rhodospirillaceae bacterium]|nr:MAG: ABC transporter [Rhodospirillaceae bacterium]
MNGHPDSSSAAMPGGTSPSPRPMAPSSRPPVGGAAPGAPRQESGGPPALFNTPATEIPLRAGEIFALDDPGLVWHVREGSVEVFAVQRHDGAQVGPRTFMCAVEAGGLTFGLKPSGPENEIRLMGLAVADSVLVRYRLEDSAKVPLPVQQAKILARPINAWIEGLSEGVVKHIQPRSHTKLWIAPGEEISLSEAERASSHKGVVWVQLMDGNGRYVDICEIPSPAGTAMVALSVHAWLREDGVKKLKGYATDIVLRLPGWSQRLEAFHDAIIESLSFGFRNAATTEQARLDKRASQMASDTEQTLVKFISLLDPESPYRPGITAEDALFECCAMVGKVLGLTMTPPPAARRKRIEDPPLMVDDIARYSQVRARQVALRGVWWIEDNGPLVSAPSRTTTGRLPWCQANGAMFCMNRCREKACRSAKTWPWPCRRSRTHSIRRCRTASSPPWI